MSQFIAPQRALQRHTMREVEVRDGVTVTVEEQYNLPNEAGAVVWDSALVLVHYLIFCQGQGAEQLQSDQQLSSCVKGKAVLEMGAGTGLCGLVASSLGATSVVLTDLPHLIPHIEQNIKLNNMQDSVTAAALEWGNAAHIRQCCKLFMKKLSHPASGPEDLNKMHPDIILGSDLIYKAEEVEALLFTLAVLSGPNTLIILAHEERPGSEDFPDIAASNGFRHEKVPRDRLHPDWSTDDISVILLRRGSTSLEGGGAEEMQSRELTQ